MKLRLLINRTIKHLRKYRSILLTDFVLTVLLILTYSDITITSFDITTLESLFTGWTVILLVKSLLLVTLLVVRILIEEVKYVYF